MQLSKKKSSMLAASPIPGERATRSDSRPSAVPSAGSSTATALFRSPKVRRLLLCLLLAGVTTAIYAPTFRYQFIDYDDDAYVFNNPQVSSGINWQTLSWAFTTDAAGNWHPITWISHALDCQLYGLDNPGGHHASSALLHVLNTVLLFLFLAWVTGANGLSFAVAMLFALHPFNVESVTWVAERKNVLCTFFFMVSLLGYVWYAKRPGIGRYVSVMVLFALGLMSKPMIVTLPLLLLLLDVWPLCRVRKWTKPSTALPLPQISFPQALLEKVPLLLLSGASSVVTMIVQQRGKSIVSFSDSPLTWRLENAAWAYATYLWKAFLPWHLAPFYPTMFLPIWKVILAVLSLLAVSWAIWILSRGRHYLAVGYLWFLGTLVPVIGFIQIGSQSMADRYAYIPLIGIFIAVVWGASALAYAAHFDRRLLYATMVFLFAALAMITERQIHYWKNSIDLWTHALQVTVPNFVAEEDLAVGLANENRNDEALPHFIMALRIRPTDPTALLNIGINLEAHGRHVEAIHEFETVIRSNDDPEHLSEAHRREGVIYAQLGEHAKARSNFLQALQLAPNDPVVMQNLSMLEVEDSVKKMTTFVSSHPSARAFFQLGQLLEEDRNIPDARKAYLSALHLDPNFADATNALHAIGNN